MWYSQRQKTKKNFTFMANKINFLNARLDKLIAVLTEAGLIKRDTYTDALEIPKPHWTGIDNTMTKGRLNALEESIYRIEKHLKVEPKVIKEEIILVKRKKK